MQFFEDDTLVLPDIQNLSITASGDDVQLNWDYPFAADEYDILSDTSPDSTFGTLEDTVTLPSASFPATAKKFYRVLARRAFGL